MSIPPLIITMLIPQDVMISADCDIRILKKFCAFRKPSPRKIIAPAYIRTNTITVISNSKFVSERLFFCCFVAAAAFVDFAISADLLCSMLRLFQFLSES